MNYEISEELKRILKKLDSDLLEKVLKKIDKVMKEPVLGKPLKYKFSGLRSERVENFRLIYEIKEDLIVFHTFEHRKKVYK